MASGDTKTEAMLNVLGNGGSGDEFRGCCNTKTQQYILDAIDRINRIQPGGSYDAGTGINIADNTISVDTTTIQEKVITVLTDDDANITIHDGDDDIDYIATWLLDGGTYKLADDATVEIVANMVDNGDDTYSVDDIFNADDKPLIITNNDLSIETNPDITILCSYGGGTYNAINSHGVASDHNWFTDPFTGTDGYEAGHSGLVPAPLTTDADKFLKSDGTWQEAGGGGPTVVQITGSSTTDVMSQNATTGMVYADPSNKTQICLGTSANAQGSFSIGLGYSSQAKASNSVSIGVNANVGTYSNNSVALGRETSVASPSSVALGFGASAQNVGEINIGTNNALGYGWNNTDYRIIRGVHDGQDAHDAATVAQGNTLSTSAPTTSTVGVLGQLYTDTTNMHTYQCTAISGSTYTWTQRW